MNKNEFLNRLQGARQKWDQFVAAVPAEKFTSSMNPGKWSMKDTVAHITWYDREMVDVLRTRTIAGSDWWNLPLDERNQLIYEQFRDLPVEEILRQHRQIYAELWQLAKLLDDEDLNDPARFKDMPAEWKPWEMIASNTYDHYLEHLGQPFSS